MMAQLRVAIADDHALFRQGLRSLLSMRADFTVVGEADRVDAVAGLLAGSACDVLLLDLQMDRDSLGEVAKLSASTKVIVVTASERVEDALAAIRAGASGVVFKRFAVQTLMDALRAVADGQVWMPPNLQASMATALREPSRDPLTPREREIVELVARGLRNAEVAKKLGITEDTVKSHLNNVFQKLNVRDRVQLTLYALRHGIVRASREA
jgi:two-component system, NarL family, nitrate/nitrite response regulator NarL